MNIYISSFSSGFLYSCENKGKETFEKIEKIKEQKYITPYENRWHDGLVDTDSAHVETRMKIRIRILESNADKSLVIFSFRQNRTARIRPCILTYLLTRISLSRYEARLARFIEALVETNCTVKSSVV